MKSIIFIVVFCFFIGLGYIDHSRYGIVYNSLEQSNSDLEDNDKKNTYHLFSYFLNFLLLESF